MEEKRITDIAVHSYHIDDVVSQLQTHVRLGLSPEEAANRLAAHGPNELVEVPGPTLLHRLIQQLKDFLILILFLGMILLGLRVLRPIQLLGRPHNCAICGYTITAAPNNARRLP
jgi:magnesium-transporting ATPase (P-type)